MRFDFLREPLSEDSPCGPDLEETFDPVYAQWTAEASGVIPERFYTPQMGGGVTVFDRASINYDEQERRILELLRRSKDLRLLVLDARFQLLAGNLVGFSEALAGVEMLTTGFWEGFHPQPFDGTDYVMRVNTLEAFNDNALIIPALHRVPLLTGRRTQITYRNFLVATGALTPYEGEEVMTRDNISRTLSPPQESPESAPTRERLTATRDVAMACLATLGVIRQTFIDKAGHTNAPSFEMHYKDTKGVEQITGLEPILRALVAFLNENLGIAEVVTDSETDEDGGEATGTPAYRGSIANHAGAAAALKAVEGYFLKTEPSSPALILVHQARLLIGRPLTEALETLMPEPASRASFRFESGYPFSIDLTRMKLVTDNLLASAADDAPAEGDSWSGSSESTDDSSWGSSDESSEASSEEATEGDEPSDAGSGEETTEETAEEGTAASLPAVVGTTVELASANTFNAATRLEASQLLSAVEGFFRQVEPSSPIPTLLIRARGYFGKDFSAILNEMMPQESSSSNE